MKARLLQYEGVLQLLLCNGKIKTVSPADAYEFLIHFDNQSYYSGPGKWDYEGVTMESFRGETIATVSDTGILSVENAESFRTILTSAERKLLTVGEYAELHKKQISVIRRLCQQNRIAGAYLKGNTWLIPEKAPYPPDERIRLDKRTR